jgi:hypothetical protein
MFSIFKGTKIFYSFGYLTKEGLTSVSSTALNLMCLSLHKRTEKLMQNLSRKPERKRPHGRPGHTWGRQFKMGV